MTARRTYIDYNASAPLRPEARVAVIAAMELVGNPSSVHAEGRKVRAAIEAARLNVADLVGASVADVVFTSGASEANASVIAGGWDSIYLSALEHDSVWMSARRCGARLIEVPVTPNGRFDVAAFTALIEQANRRAGEVGKVLVCIQLANNETGVIQPVAEVAVLARARGWRVHSDAVQAPGRMALDCAALGVDYLTLSAHKLGGPKGVGALVCVDGAPLPVLIAGGGQERGRRAGTENVAAIAGFGAAARLARMDVVAVDAVRDLRDRLERTLRTNATDVVVIGANEPRLPNTCCVALEGLSAETAVIRMDLAGVAISAGAACSSGKVAQSAALLAMGLPAGLARSAIRISFGHESTMADVDAFVAAWTILTARHQRAA